NGTAVVAMDYTATSGVLTFNPGETSKTFTVAVTEHTSPQGPKTVNLTLSSPSGGALLGTRSTATLTIIDKLPLPVFVALTPTNKLLSVVASASPGTVPAPITITGLQSGESILAIDYRPVNGQLYGLGSTSRLYTINVATGAATQVGSGTFAVPLSGTAFGF